MPGRLRTTIAAITLASFWPAGLARADDCGLWTHYPAPSPGTQFNILFDVAGVRSNDVWAVGRSDDDFGFPNLKTLAIHWDGSAWTQFPTPSPSFNSNELNGVAALASDNVIAVGFHNGGGAAQTLTLRFDGSQWTSAPSLVLPGGSAFYSATVVGDGPDRELWAVGIRAHDNPPGSARPLTARWTGSGWQEFPVPTRGAWSQSDNAFAGIAGLSPTDIWAVGRFRPSELSPSFPLIQRWNGSEWMISLDISTELGASALEAVAAIAPDLAVAVGYRENLAIGLVQPLIMKWNGASWATIELPHLLEGPAELHAVAARAHNDIWAAGTYANAEGQPRPLMYHFNGETWSIRPAAITDGDQEWFRGMAVIPGGEIWAVGHDVDDDGAQRSLTERRCSDQPGCPADLNGDGLVDFADYLEFLNLYEAQDPRADYTGDGLVDFSDYLEFLNHYGAGC